MRNLDRPVDELGQSRNDRLARLLVEGKRDEALALDLTVGQRLDRVDLGGHAAELGLGGNDRLRLLDGDRAFGFGDHLAVYGLGDRQVLVVERHQPVQPVAIDALLERNVGLDVAGDLTGGEVVRHQPGMTHRVDRIVGGEFGDGRRIAGDVDVERADDGPHVRLLDRELAVACGHGTPARQIDRARRQGDVDVVALVVDDARGVPHRRDQACRIEARAFDMKGAEQFVGRQRHAIAGAPGLDTGIEAAPSDTLPPNTLLSTQLRAPRPENQGQSCFTWDTGMSCTLKATDTPGAFPSTKRMDAVPSASPRPPFTTISSADRIFSSGR